MISAVQIGVTHILAHVHGDQVHFENQISDLPRNDVTYTHSRCTQTSSDGFRRLSANENIGSSKLYSEAKVRG